MNPGTDEILIRQIDAILPQTQCTKCGYDGCLPYARAIADGQADINRCPPGGDQGVIALATLLQRTPKPIDPTCGRIEPLKVAVIDEEHCIGCTLCIKACPVDAIVGTNKRMHTVLEDWCTGCDLCIAPCPVDCITMEIVTKPELQWTAERAALARQRHMRHQERRARKADQPNVNKTAATPVDKHSVIAAALAKARTRRQASQ